MAPAVLWLSVVVGVALGLWQRVGSRATGPIRTFAVVAAGLVVALSLLPHALESEGLAGLGAALASVALVPALERVLRVPFRHVSGEALRLELGYAGLLLHRFGDGVVMSVEDHGAEIAWTIGAHEVPIVALVTLAYARRSLGQALGRATLLGLSSSLGYFIVSSRPGAWQDLHGWIDAVAAGILVHILVYEALPETLATARERALDGVGALLGALVILLPWGEEHPEGPDVGSSLLRAALDAAPVLIIGLLASAWVASRVPLERPRQWFGVGVARPWPGLETFSLLMRSFGWRVTLGYVLGSALLAAAAGGLLRRVAGAPQQRDATAEAEPLEPRPLLVALEGVVLRVGGWIALGLLGASYIDTFAEPGSLLGLDTPLELLLLWGVAAPAAVASGCAVPIAAALAAKGLSPVIAAGGVVLGAVLGNALAALSRRGVTAARAGVVVAPLGLSGAALALVADAALGSAAGWAPGAPASGLVEWLSLVALAAMVALSVWRVGIRGWLGASLQPFGSRPHRERAHAH